MKAATSVIFISCSIRLVILRLSPASRGAPWTSGSDPKSRLTLRITSIRLQKSPY